MEYRETRDLNNDIYRLKVNCTVKLDLATCHNSANDS